MAQTRSTFSSVVDQIPQVFCYSYTCDTVFLTCQCIQTQFPLVQLCSHTVLQVFDRFTLLVHTEPTEIGSMRTALADVYTKWSGHTDTFTITQMPIIQGQNHKTVTKCIYIYTCTLN
jgi:hypothetical protein